jgi:hypothetical protein
MTSTSARAGRGERTHSGTRSGGSPVLRAAGRELLATAGNQVLKAAVDRAVGRVDQAADRLDAFAAGGGRVRPANPTREPAEHPDHGRVGRAGRAVQVRMGAAFSLLVHQMARILEFIRRLAQQLVAALAHLIRRAGKGESDSEAAEPRRVERMAPSGRTRQQRPAGGRGDGAPAGSAASAARSPQAARRTRPRPAAEPSSGRRGAGPKRTGEGRQG